MTGYHQPVLLDEVISVFEPLSGKTIIDATIGGAGHAKNLLSRGARVIGIDADPDAIEYAKKELRSIPGGKWEILQGNFRDLKKIVSQTGITSVDGVLMDLGVSSYQINNPEKGFRYLERNAKLDMRFDPSSVQTAADILNTASCAELYEIFSKYGEEKRSRAIAAFIVSTRTVSPIETAGNLTDLIDKSVGNGEKIATTARIFQALRIRVNDELASLRNGLADARDLLAKDGKLAVISFHSLEDRIVKLTFRQANDLIELNKKPIEATENEVRDNKRSRSAKLRIAVKI